MPEHDAPERVTDEAIDFLLQTMGSGKSAIPECQAMHSALTELKERRASPTCYCSFCNINFMGCLCPSCKAKLGDVTNYVRASPAPVSGVTEARIEAGAIAIDQHWMKDGTVRDYPFPETETSYQEHCRSTAEAVLTAALSLPTPSDQPAPRASMQIDAEWLKRKLASHPDEGEIGVGFELFPAPASAPPAPVEVTEAMIQAEVCAAEIEWNIHDDGDRAPREFWHARIVWRQMASEWVQWGELGQYRSPVPDADKAHVEETLRAGLRASLTAALQASKPSEEQS